MPSLGGSGRSGGDDPTGSESNNSSSNSGGMSPDAKDKQNDNNYGSTISGLGQGYSGIDDEGKFTGVVDDSLGLTEKTIKNFQTNLAVGWGNLKTKSTLSKLGIGLTAASTPTLAAIAAVAVGIKSLSQALSEPGLSESDKKSISEGVKNFQSLPDEDRTEIINDFKDVGGLTENATTESTTTNTTEPAFSRPFWDQLVDEFYGTGEFSVPDQYKDVVSSQQLGNQTSKETPSYQQSAINQNAGENGSIFPNNKYQIDPMESTGVSIDENGNIVNGNTQLSGASYKDLTYADAEHLADAAKKYQSGWEQANTEHESTLERLMNETAGRTTDLKTAETKQNSLLDSLIAESQSGTGNYKPFNFKFMGNDMAFVPKAQMAQANNLAEMGQQQYTNAGDFYNKALAGNTQQTGIANDKFEGAGTTLDKIMSSAQMTSPSNAGLKYLQGLLDMANQEETRGINDLDEAYRNKALKEGIAVNNRQLDQNEPGTLDQIMGGLTLWNAANNKGTTGTETSLLDWLGL